ncbi:hypothetical protein JNUCC0626_40080 [Lentzea sp. JNUCC 0626]|uniref:hypothetical protein n=1 Tax=Lentzea sp. JNUCC 0626 TaxID=3367513 RepID=UPI0037487672
MAIRDSVTASKPLIIRAAIVTAVTALLHVLVVVGALPLDVEAERAIADAVDLVGTAVLVVWTRGSAAPSIRDSEITKS